MKFSTVLGLWVISSISIALGANNSCNVRQLTNNCELFTKLNPEDELSLPSGKKIPACVLSSLKGKFTKEFEDKKKAALASFAKELKEVPDEIFSESFKEFLLKYEGGPLAADFSSQGDSLFNYPLPAHRNDSNPQEENLKHMGTKAFYSLMEPYFKERSQMELLKSLVAKARIANESQFSYEKKAYAGIKHKRPLDLSQRTNGVFIRAKQCILDYLRSLKTDNVHITQIRKRVNASTVDASEDSLPPIGRELDCGPSFFAFNQLDTNTVQMPYTLFSYPDESLVRTAAHEIAHSFDLIQSQSDLAKYKKTSLQRTSNPFDGESEYGFPGSDTPKDSYDVESTSMPEASSPFSKIWFCLASKEGGSFGSPNLAKGKLTSESAHEEHQACEAFSDWIAAEVIGNEISQKPKKEQKAAVMDYLIFGLDAACSDILTGKSDAGDSHPNWERRMNDILLKNENIAAALGCPINQPCKMDKNNLRTHSQKNQAH